MQGYLEGGTGLTPPPERVNLHSVWGYVLNTDTAMATGGTMTDFREKSRRGIFELGFESRRGVHQAEKVEVRREIPHTSCACEMNC